MKLNPYSIKFRTTVSVLGILLLVILADVLWRTPASRERHGDEARAIQAEMASQMAASFDYSFRQAIREIEAIAALPDVVSMRREGLDRVLGQVNQVTQFFNYYFVLDTEGRWVSFPSAPGRVGQKIPERNMGWVRRTLQNDRTVFLDVVRSLAGTLVSGFSTPIRDEKGRAVGVLRGVIVTTDENSVLNTVLGTTVGVSGYPYMVSADGWLIAHPRESIDVERFERYDYKKHAPVARCIQGQAGVESYSYQGETWVAAYQPIEATGWCVVVQQPEADILSAARRESGTLHITTAGMSVAIAVVMILLLNISLRPLGSLVGAVRKRRPLGDEEFSRDEIGQLAREFNILYRDLSQSETALRDHRDRLEELVEERTSRLREANERLEREVAERLRVEEAIRGSLREKEVLLREIHHRVKNNMQVISSLLGLQAASTDDQHAADLLKVSQRRIRSLALIQERVFELDDLTRVNFKQFVEQVVRMLFRAYGTDTNRIAVEEDMGGVTLDVDTAVPCGLIVSELVSNSLRHAFPGDRHGTIRVSLRKAQMGALKLSVSDDGIGMPSETSQGSENALGLRLVRTVAEGQLRGRMTVGGQEGTTVTVEFRQAEYEHRV